VIGVGGKCKNEAQRREVLGNEKERGTWSFVARFSLLRISREGVSEESRPGKPGGREEGKKNCSFLITAVRKCSLGKGGSISAVDGGGEKIPRLCA